MINAEKGNAIAAIGIFVLLPLIILTFTVLQPYFESRAYNRLTGAHTTYWDAVFLELRVQDQPK